MLTLHRLSYIIFIILLITTFQTQVLAETKWSCHASGIYSLCNKVGDWLNCYDQTSTGMGIHEQKSIAEIQAVMMCDNNSTSMVIIGNMGDGGSVKIPCAVTTCESFEGDKSTTPNNNQPENKQNDWCSTLKKLICDECGQEAPMCQEALVATVPEEECKKFHADYSVGVKQLKATNQLKTWCQTGQIAQVDQIEEPTSTLPPVCQKAVDYLCQECSTQSAMCQAARSVTDATDTECSGLLEQYQQGVPVLRQTGQLESWCAGN